MIKMAMRTKLIRLRDTTIERIDIKKTAMAKQLGIDRPGEISYDAVIRVVLDGKQSPQIFNKSKKLIRK